MTDDYRYDSISERYIELYEHITGEKFVKEDTGNIAERIEKNVTEYFNGKWDNTQHMAIARLSEPKNTSSPTATDGKKSEQVEEMFDNIAPAYDKLNHTLSMGIDRSWRRKAINIPASFPPPTYHGRSYRHRRFRHPCMPRTATRRI